MEERLLLLPELGVDDGEVLLDPPGPGLPLTAQDRVKLFELAARPSDGRPALAREVIPDKDLVNCEPVNNWT